ncbi:MAG: hypothetical protein ACLRZ6_08750 [Lachnospiraceae bacterium]
MKNYVVIAGCGETPTLEARSSNYIKRQHAVVKDQIYQRS